MWRKQILCLSRWMLGWMATALPATAQIAGDGTLGTQVNKATIAPCIGMCTITGGVEQGTNLFHSFQEFSIPTGGQAWFNNSPQIQNILTRVTGNSISNLDGLIKTNGTANFFFLNPNGIVFGSNAQLQIGGSFFASTASSFKFADGSEFGAIAAQTPPLLAVHVTPGLQTGSLASGATIINRGSLTTGQDLTLDSSQLDLQGRLIAGRDLTLNAQNTVKVRESTATTPFVAQSGRDLTIQGNQGIDILAMNPPQSVSGEREVAFQSGRNLSLISNGLISGDAHFNTNGEFQIRSLSGQLGKFTSLYDPIISSSRNVDIAAAYTGASLLIESQGSVRVQGEITIANPDVRSAFVGSDAILQTEAGLIIRSGQPNLVYGGLQNPSPAYTSATVPQGITLLGNVDTAGAVILNAGTGNVEIQGLTTNGGKIEITSAGAITTNNQSLDTRNFEQTGGDIFLTARVGSISTGELASYSSSFPESNSANGGKIVLSATNGNITTGNLYSYSFGYSDLSRVDGSSGNGGDISLSVVNGNITTGFLTSAAIALANSRFSSGNTTSGNGGNISLSALNGNIKTEALTTISDSSSVSVSASAGRSTSRNGGRIAVRAVNGMITTGDLDAFSSSSSLSGSFFSAFPGISTSGTGGEIFLETTHGNITTGGMRSRSSAFSFSGNSTSGNGEKISLSTSKGNITTSKIESYSLSSSLSESRLFPSDSTSRNGGKISLSTADGSIQTGDLSSFTFASSFLGRTLGSNAGEISLTADKGNLEAGTLGSYAVSERGLVGNGGNVTLAAKNQVAGLEILTLSSGASAGNFDLKGLGDLSVTDARILTSKQVTLNTVIGEITIPVGGQGQSGNVAVSSLGNLTFNNTSIESDTKGSDPAGNVTLTSPGLITFKNSQIISNTVSSGQAGSIVMNAGQGITFNDNSQLSATTSSAGKAGNITLSAPQLILQQGAQISTTATPTATNSAGGSISLNASDMYLAGTVGVFAETQGQTPAGTLRLNPDADRPDLRVTLTPNARISASTSGSGKGGDLILTAPRSLTLMGAGKLAVETSGTGNAGNIQITAQQINLTDKVNLSASTSSNGKAGDIQISAQTLNLNQSATIATNTAGIGQAGNITLDVTDQFTLAGSETGLFATTTPGSIGKGGNITLAPRAVLIQKGASIAVNSQGSGVGGSIGIQAGRLELRDRGSITAETASAQGGNIMLDARDLLLLRQNSLISATAGLDQAIGSGKGGNIMVTTPLLVAVPRENSDITANAAKGNGGQVTIQANLIGIQPRPRLTEFSDITASSDSGIEGTIAINTPDVDPNRGLVQLSVSPTDPSSRIDQSCAASAPAASRFTMIGRGGLPSHPDEFLTANNTLSRLAQMPKARELQSPQSAIPAPIRVIVEAQGAVWLHSGKIRFAAQASVPQSSSIGLSCQAQSTVPQ